MGDPDNRCTSSYPERSLERLPLSTRFRLETRCSQRKPQPDYEQI